MPIAVACSCGQKFAARDELAGKTVKCPKCQKPLKIPGGASAAAASGGATAGARAPQRTPQAGQSAPAKPVGGISDLLDEAGFSAPKPHAGPRCPACDAPMQPGAVLCVECGFNTQSGQRLATLGEGGIALTAGRPMTDGEKMVAKAARELAEAPIATKGSQFGDVRSIGAWILPIFLPILLLIALAVTLYWGGVIAGQVLLIFRAIAAGEWGLIIPFGLILLGTALWIAGWFNISLTAIDKHVAHGILSLTTLGSYSWFIAPIYWEDCRSGGNLLYNGYWTIVLGLVSLFAIAMVKAGVYLPLVPMLMMFAGGYIIFLAWLKMTVEAIKNHFLPHGLLCLILGIYVLVYGIIFWKDQKKSMILYLVGLGILFVGFLAFILAILIGAALPGWSEIVPQPK